MPPFLTPGDGRVIRQGTSLLYRAGEKTRASAPWGSKNRLLEKAACFFERERGLEGFPIVSGRFGY